MSRINYLDPSTATGEAKKFFDTLGAQVKKPSTLVTALAHRPAILKAIGSLSQAVGGESSIPKRLKELVILKVSQINGCKYCVAAHKRSAQKIGLGEPEFTALANYAESDVFSDAEKVALDYAEVVTKQVGNCSTELFEKLKTQFDDGEIVELTGLIAFFNFMNRLLDALQVDIDFQ